MQYRNISLAGPSIDNSPDSVNGPGRTGQDLVQTQRIPFSRPEFSECLVDNVSGGYGQIRTYHHRRADYMPLLPRQFNYNPQRNLLDWVRRRRNTKEWNRRQLVRHGAIMPHSETWRRAAG